MVSTAIIPNSRGIEGYKLVTSAHNITLSALKIGDASCKYLKTSVEDKHVVIRRCTSLFKRLCRYKDG
jgi:hypothetical protein